MALVMLLTQFAPPGSRAASLSTTGRWSSTGDLGVVGTHARLVELDAQGRRVRKSEGEYAAGRQAFVWDLRHASGPRVAPGIYTYRVIAGAFRAQRKLVVLP
jgi:flagellar hook assembly protein FlgD